MNMRAIETDSTRPNGGIRKRWREKDHVPLLHPIFVPLTYILVAIVNAFVAWTTRGPVIIPDETGVLGNAKYLSQMSPDWTLAGSSYMPGMGMILSPAWWFTQDSQLVYQCGLLLIAGMATLLVFPLSRILRYFGVPHVAATVIAGVVAIAPARTVVNNYLMSESLLVLLTAFVVVVAMRLVARPTPKAAVALGVTASAVFFTHGRGLAIVIAVLGWVAICFARNVRILASTTAAIVVGVALSWWIYTSTTRSLYWDSDRVDEEVGKLVDLSFADLISDLVGMAWYSVAAWPALAAAGVLILVWALRRDPVSLLIVLMGLAAVGLALITLNDSSASQTNRIDAYIYGRYIDYVTTIIAAIGLGVLVRLRSWVFSGAVLAFVAIVCLAFQFLTLPRIPAGGRWFDVHFAGVAHYFSHHNYAYDIREPWELFSIATLGITAAFVVLSRIKHSLIWVSALYFGAITVANDVVRVDPWDQRFDQTPSARELVSVVPESTSIAMDADVGSVINVYAFAANPREVEIAYLDDGVPDSPYVLSWDANPTLERAGAVPVDARDSIGLVMWVLPGPEQDRLAASGDLAAPASAG